MSIITNKYLHECFTYDPLTGILIWKERPRHHFKTEHRWRFINRKCAGKAAGSANSFGYLRTFVGGREIMVHRIAWAMLHDLELAELPEEIDHKNLNKKDNRKENLRAANRSLNKFNIGIVANNTSGFKGVTWYKGDQRWCARIAVRGKRYNLGLFKTKEEAADARAKAQHLHGEFARLTAANDDPQNTVAA